MRQMRRVFWFGRVMIVVLILSCLVLVGTIYAARAPDRYVCLRFNGDTLVDLSTGAHAHDTRPSTSLSLGSSQYSRAFSPDGKHVAYLGPGVQSGRLFIGEVGGQPTLVRDNVDWLAANAWSPDGKRLVYVWWSDAHSHVGIMNADGGDPQSIAENGDPSFVSWSSDGAYLALLAGDPQRRQLSFWSVPGLQRMPFAPFVSLVSGLVWDWQGHRLAFAWRDEDQNLWLSLASPEQAADITFALARNSYDHRIAWSPDNRFVAVRYYSQWPSWRFDIFGVDGEAFENVAETTPIGDSFTQPSAVWSANGESLTFTAQRSSGRDLVVYRLGTHSYDTLAANLNKPPFYAPGERRMALYRREEPGRTVALDLMDVDGANRAPLIAGAEDAGDPYWSNDGQMIAVVWATGQQKSRVVRLTWARADGTQRHDLEDGFLDVRDLRWLDDGQSMAFVARRGAGYGVEVVNLETGAHFPLAEGFAQVAGLEQEAESGHIVFWWRTADGDSGVDGYDLHGKRLYRLKAIGSIDGQRLFWSPDERVAALKLGPRGDESLQVASRDDQSTHVVRDGLIGLGDPLWSPDGSMLAFTQANRTVKGGQITLEVVAADGSRVRQFDEFRGFYQNLTWTKCD
jgi:Tol biopolymer transport system component